MLDFNQRIVLITGAARGIGLAYARALGARGAHVIVHDAGTDGDGVGRDPDVAVAAAAMLQDAGYSAEPASDVIETREGCRELVARILARHGRLDSVIHNAGWVGYQAIDTLTPDFLARATAIHLNAPAWLAQAAWPAMVAQGHGRILLTTSDRALYPQYAQAGLAAYAATKMAAVGLMNALALEGAPHDIRVNAISPVAKTRMWGVTEQPTELTPDSVAPGAVFLVSDGCNDSGWILRASNGQFHAVRASEAADVDYPRDIRGVVADSAETVASHWAEIAPVCAEYRQPQGATR
ncbi:Short chain dehydrogenase/reductase [Salinisphaera sp. S4-8]|uniref:SDR family NAD(P)-dependent oxidoreductase n=1 Tax=Salinisphaera sp. S4-8 TaxID=633357 RepID=UPI0033405649